MIQERRNKKAAINISRTRADKTMAQTEHTEVNKQVKSSIRTDKRKYVEDLAMTGEKAAREGIMRQLYDAIKKLSGNHRKPERPMKKRKANKIWDEEQVPTDWKEEHLIKIPKKGDLSKCEDYRGITLLSIPGKVCNWVLLNRMKDSVDAQLRDQQAGFRKDRSCTDQITTLRVIVEQSIEWNSSLNQLH
ncbi:unnamed protein product [Schistosoma mattheei]|uniref:Uncharacterized protein n=1 Tax=Schistosoma mattheei TaxID=31246 RepID=A0A183Q7M2_9TREM|nr:unnamed protein product [Schistosoma mattheei]